MLRRLPRSTRTYTLCPYTTLTDLAAGISERDIMRVAAGILIDCDQARHAAAADIFAAHGMARTLGGDHDDIDVGGRPDQPEMDVEAVREGDRRAGAGIDRKGVV